MRTGENRTEGIFRDILSITGEEKIVIVLRDESIVADSSDLTIHKWFV